MPSNPNFPSEFVVVEYFFPVNVLAAVTLTPGNGVLPLRAEPLISYAGGVAGAVADGTVCAGGGGAASCASKLHARKVAIRKDTEILRAMNIKFRSPWAN
jgi:hypothetical protein